MIHVALCLICLASNSSLFGMRPFQVSPPIDIPGSPTRKLYEKNCSENLDSDNSVNFVKKNAPFIAGTYVEGPFFLEGNFAQDKSDQEDQQDLKKNSSDALFIKAIRDQIYYNAYSDPEELKRLIEDNCNANVTIQGEMQMTLLHLVARHNIPIEKGKPVSAQIDCLLEIIQILKDRGANFYAKNNIDKTPYDLACMLNKPQVILNALAED